MSFRSSLVTIRVACYSFLKRVTAVTFPRGIVSRNTPPPQNETAALDVVLKRQCVNTFIVSFKKYIQLLLR